MNNSQKRVYISSTEGRPRRREKGRLVRLNVTQSYKRSVKNNKHD